jgi:hypothetical protein
MWANAEEMIASSSPRYSSADLHPGITSPYLRNVLLRFRLYLASPTLNPVSCTPEQQVQFGLFSLWTATRFVDDAVKLLTHFLELADSRDLSSSGSPDNQAVTTNSASTALLWEAMLTLTTFCTIRNYVHCPYLDDTGIDLRDASYILAPKYRETLESLLNVISAEEEKRNGEVLLWIHFTGALFEKRSTLYRHQMLEKIAEDEDEEKAWWFCRKLADQARQLNSMRWTDAAKTLARFAYADEFLKPEPQEWWDSIFEL